MRFRVDWVTLGHPVKWLRMRNGVTTVDFPLLTDGLELIHNDYTLVFA